MSGPSRRLPAVAGAFYPADGVELAHELERCFRDPRGPGGLPPRERRPERRLRALVVPHAGYRYSGPIAADAFAVLAAERPPETVLLLGVNHHGRGAPAALSDEDWETPIGIVQTDRSLLGALRRGPLEVDRLAHAREHSIEVELPFLQYVHPRPQFVALGVSFGPLAFLLDVAAIVRGALAGRDVLVIASTDFSHYIPAERARTLDRHAIDPILARNAEGLYRAVVDEELTMCGIAPTTVLLAALEAEPLEARLLRWGHSGEAEPMREVVGYAAISFESESPLR